MGTRSAMSDIEEVAARRQSLDEIRAAGVDPYPPRPGRTHSAAEALAGYDEGRDPDQQPTVSVAGRMLTPRLMGKAAFVHLLDASGRVQVYVKRDDVGEEQFALFKRLHPGDFLWASGRMFRTKSGEVSVHAQEIRLLAKTLRPLPDLYHGVRDKELRYRKRYLDLIANRESFDRLMAACADRHRRAALPGRPRLPGGGDAGLAVALWRCPRPPVRHPLQRPRRGLLPADRPRALPQAAADRRLRPTLRDRARLPQRGPLAQAQPRVHDA